MKKKDKVQKAINKYGIKFHSFMLDLDHQIKNDRAFKNIKGNMFAGICMEPQITNIVTSCQTIFCIGK